MNRKLSSIKVNQASILVGAPGGPRGRAGIVCCLCTVAAVIGCGPIYYIPLKPVQASTITSTRVHATIAQEEVDAAVKVSNTPVVAGGLLGALVGAVVDTAITSHRAGEAEKLVEPIRKEVSDFDFRAAFFDSLKETLPALRTLRMATLATGKTPLTPEMLRDLRTRTRDNTFLSLITRYEFSTDFRTFSVLTTAEIFRNGQDGPLYRGTFVYDTEPIAGADEPEDAARAWAANRAAAFRAAMREGIDETMKMLVLDLGEVPVARAQAQRATDKVPASAIARASAPRATSASASPAVAAVSPTVVAPVSPIPVASSSPTAAASAVASAALTAVPPSSPTATAPATPMSPPAVASASPTAAGPGATVSRAAAAANSPTGVGPGSTDASASPTAAAPTTPAAAAPASPTAAVLARPTAAPGSPTAAPTAPAARVSPPVRAPASLPARAGRREIVRRDSGIMYSAPRQEHPVDRSAR